MILSPFIYKRTHRKKLQGELDKTDMRSDETDTCRRTQKVTTAAQLDGRG